MYFADSIFGYDVGTYQNDVQFPGDVWHTLDFLLTLLFQTILRLDPSHPDFHCALMANTETLFVHQLIHYQENGQWNTLLH